LNQIIELNAKIDGFLQQLLIFANEIKRKMNSEIAFVRVSSEQSRSTLTEQISRKAQQHENKARKQEKKLTEEISTSE
jgi:uncharacterized iron-regulated membrane protein